MDKFLISVRKIEPVSYTFWTVVMGALILVFWPWTFSHIGPRFILLDILSGVAITVAMYVFFVALSQGEVSRVVPFVYGIVPVFDILIGLVFHRNALRINEAAALFLLIPGALLVSHQQGSFWGKHVKLKILAAFLFSAYFALWQYAAQTGTVLNNLMWNRLGAAGILIILLVFPAFRRKVFHTKQVKRKKGTAFIFLFKQALGGFNFIFLAALFTLGKISIINALQGFRYVFLLFISALLSKKRRHLHAEESHSWALTQKSFGIILIFLGTILLFI
jgi:uncharacterized membrane protein